jgi:hypothetical protein
MSYEGPWFLEDDRSATAYLSEVLKEVRWRLLDEDPHFAHLHMSERCVLTHDGSIPRRYGTRVDPSGFVLVRFHFEHDRGRRGLGPAYFLRADLGAPHGLTFWPSTKALYRPSDSRDPVEAEYLGPLDRADPVEILDLIREHVVSSVLSD